MFAVPGKAVLSNSNFTAPHRGRTIARALACVAIAALLPGGPAKASEAAGAAEAMGPREPIITAVPRAEQRAREKRERERRERELAGPPDDSVDESGGISLYGPPVPKVERGKLADIRWPEAPEVVPPALETAINIVTRNYPSAKSGRAAVRAAAADLKAAKWRRFPTVTADVAYLDSRSRDGSGSGPEPTLSVEQPIWSGGRIISGIRRARASEDVESADYVAIVEDLAQQTSQTYFEIARLTVREQLFAESLKEHLRLVETMERRVEQEVSPLADLELARSRAAQIEQEYTITRAARETALRVMAELIADPTYDLGPIPAYNPQLDLPERQVLEDQAVAFDPELRRFGAQADVARAELDARKAAILPQLNAQYSYDEFRGSRVGVVVRAQSVGGLSQISEVNSARLRIQSALENRRQAEQRLRRDVAADIINFEAAKARASISTRASETAARVSESYVRQFIAGRRSWLDVMNALREAVSAQVGKSDAEFSAMATAVQLTLRSGRWRPQFDRPEEPAVDDGTR